MKRSPRSASSDKVNNGLNEKIIEPMEACTRVSAKKNINIPTPFANPLTTHIHRLRRSIRSRRGAATAMVTPKSTVVTANRTATRVAGLKPRLMAAFPTGGAKLKASVERRAAVQPSHGRRREDGAAMGGRVVSVIAVHCTPCPLPGKKAVIHSLSLGSRRSNV